VAFVAVEQEVVTGLMTPGDDNDLDVARRPAWIRHAVQGRRPPGAFA
jgi:hypothetical protein